MPTPADIVIKRFGTPQDVADALGIHVAQIYRMRKGGKRRAPGVVPAHYHGRLLAAAKARGIALRPAELVERAA